MVTLTADKIAASESSAAGKVEQPLSLMSVLQRHSATPMQHLDEMGAINTTYVNSRGEKAVTREACHDGHIYELG